MIFPLALLLATLVLRTASSSRRVHGKLLTSCLLFATSAAAAALAAYGPLPASVAAQIRIATPLLLAFGITNALVVLAINPWRADRIPDHYPKIVQDAIVIGLFVLAAMLFMPERIVATTAVGAVVIGFALQDTLGNLFAGLAIQIEKPFRVGHWVTIGGIDGIVSEITWRATKIRTKAGNFVVVPNSVRRQGYDHELFGADEGHAGRGRGRRQLRHAAERGEGGDPRRRCQGEPLIAPRAGAGSAARGLCRVGDHLPRPRLDDRLRRGRAHPRPRPVAHLLRVPAPRHQHPVSDPGADRAGRRRPPRRDAGDARARFDGVEILAALTDEQRAELAAVSRSLLYAAGEAIVARRRRRRLDVRAGARRGGGDALADRGVVATLRAGAFFGEMSLLTGDARSATVTAVTDCELIEVSADAFRRVVLTDAAIVDRVAAAVETRRAELERHRASRATDGAVRGNAANFRQPRAPVPAAVRSFRPSPSLSASVTAPEPALLLTRPAPS